MANQSLAPAPSSEKTDAPMSREETREILTPFAFQIDKSLFGTALALPHKRGIAMLVDLFAIAILSTAPGELLAIVLAVTFYRLGSDKRAESLGKVKGKRRRKFSRFIGALILLLLLLDWLPRAFNHDIFQESDSKQTSVSEEVLESGELDLPSTLILSKTMLEVADSMKNSHCVDLACWQNEITPKLTTPHFLSLDFKAEFIEEAVDGLVEKLDLNSTDKERLSRHLLSSYFSAKERFKQTNAGIVDTLNDKNLTNKTSDDVANADSASKEKDKSSTDKTIYSIMEYANALVNDLGLGFGWAAFYFTVLTSLWKGQTLGKRLMKIKVLQLDGTPLSMWDSFGRYGGYGAGIATGLLGFFQIYWNANRQAIHDKISSTVVIDLTKTKQSLVKQANLNNS